MRRFSRLILCLVVMLFIGSMTSLANGIEVTVDFTSLGEPINRALFSIVGVPQFYAESNEVAMSAYEQLNFVGTQARLETQSHSTEPVNDNDDPFDFNWDAFYMEHLFRFVPNDPGGFLADVQHRGMEPVLLLAYNHRWNSATGATASAPLDVEEWAEWAAAVVEFFNGNGDNYALNVKYVEVWNEPNHHWFWEGPRDIYFDLFNATAERIHANYPGVLVGGPSLSPEGEFDDFMETFLQRCGHNVDFLVYHTYLDSSVEIAEKIKYWVGRARELTGNAQLQVMITEADKPTLFSTRKQEHLMRRQFELLAISDLVDGFHQFCLSYYDENGTIFGLIDVDGPLLEYNYWPYWIFRDLVGNEANVTSTHPALRTIGAVDEETSRSNVVIYHDSTRSVGVLEDVNISLNFDSNSSSRRLVVSRMGVENGIIRVLPVDPEQTTLTYTASLAPGEALSLTLQEENVEQSLYVSQEVIRESAAPLIVGDAVVLEARILNLLGTEQTVTVTPILAGLNEEILVVQELTIPPYEKVAVQFDATLNNPKPGGYITYFKVQEAGETIYFSHAEHLAVTAPLEVFPPRNPIQVTVGEETSIKIALRNTHVRTMSGSARLEIPSDWEVITDSSTEFQIGQKRAVQLPFVVAVPDGVAPGSQELHLVVNYGEITLRLPVIVEVIE